MNRQIWAAMLAKLVAPMEPVQAAKAISAMVAMVNLPDAAFTEESVRAVTQTGRQFAPGQYGPLTRVPTFGEMATALGRWWWAKVELDRIKAAPVALVERLAAPPNPNPSPEVCAEVSAIVRAFVAEREERVAAVHRSNPKPHFLNETQLDKIYQRDGLRNPRHRTQAS